MDKSTKSCHLTPTIADKRWPYQQYYLGEKDEEQRKSGLGENHWSGAESLEWYIGKFVRDTMHGEGDYRWRYRGPEGASVSYEGQFYGNRMHGYGLMSYPDGRVFKGLFYNNVRWGPGIETHTCLQEDVGLWRGKQLVRLTWRPQTPSVTLDLNTGPDARACVEPHRTLLTTHVRTFGEVNSAIELLKQTGAQPMTAAEKWSKIYPKHCTDLASQVCHTEVFDREYYKNEIVDLKEVVTTAKPKEEPILLTEDDISSPRILYAWNDSAMTISMMKHCFKHEKQRNRSGVDLKTILIGPRSNFKPPAKHELDCRTLIMASYLGHIANVTKMVNLNNVHPDVADIQGNTALMYATCGNHADIVHFLIEAGANVNNFNDSCCNPLGVALMQLACRSKDIAPNEMVQALTPPPAVPPLPEISLKDEPSEWHMIRELPNQVPGTQLAQKPSKLLVKTSVLKKTRTSIPEEGTISKKKLNASSATGETPVVKRKSIVSATYKDQKSNAEDDSDDVFSEEKRVYNNINTEFMIRVTNLFSNRNGPNTTPYLFEINDITKGVDTIEEEYKKPSDKNPKKNISKIIKNTMKPSKDMMWQVSNEKDNSSINSSERKKIEMLSRNMSTIIQLLKDGADPRLVRCPQSALWMATVSGSQDLIRHLVQYGADINEVIAEGLNYRALDVAISQPLTYDNLVLIRAILECGARTDHRMKYGDESIDTDHPGVPGPTLLHTVLARKTENYKEEEIRQELLGLLLEYNCSALNQFKGHSALEMAMMKNMDLFEIFIKCPKVDLNAIINDRNQTVLVKMFTHQFCSAVPVAERLQPLTNMLLYGADPLQECQDGEEIYKNIFVFAKQKMSLLVTNKHSSPVVGSSKTGSKVKKLTEKPKKDDKASIKPQKEKLDHNDLGDYKQALDLVTECARILHVRWIQAKLLKELIDVVERYEHRHWNMILPEYKNQKACGLWLTHPRTLEIWDILQTAKKKTFKDRRILKHILCIVYFCCNRTRTSFKWPLTAEEKGLIEADVCCVLREHKIAESMKTKNVHSTRPYVTPKLAVDSVS